MKEKKPIIKKIKKPGVKKTASGLLFAIISFILSIGLFLGLVIVQDYLIEEVTYQTVLVAKKDIPVNLIITESNADEYFKTKNINIFDSISGAITDPSSIIGKKAIVPLYNGELITAKDFENICAYTQDIENPVEIAIEVSDLASAGGGHLRAGDLVNISMVFTKDLLSDDTAEKENETSTSKENIYNSFAEEDPIDSEFENMETEVEAVSSNDEMKASRLKTYDYSQRSQYVMEDLYIERVLDKNGVPIDSTDEKTIASILVFIIDKSEEVEFNNALVNCKFLRISKILEKPAVGYESINSNEAKEKPEDSVANTEPVK